MVARQSRNVQGPVVSPGVVVGLGVLGVVAAAVSGWVPWGAVVWGVVLVASLVAFPPELTGRKDVSGRPTAADPVQDEALSQFRVWQSFVGALWMPSEAWVPGGRVRFSWVYAGLLSVLALVWPLQDDVLAVGVWVPVVGAVLVWVCVVGVDGVWRGVKHPGDPCEGVGLLDAVGVARAWLWVVGVVVGCVTGVGLWWLLGVVSWGVVWVVPVWVPVVVVGVGVFLGVVHVGVRSEVLVGWRARIEARVVWASRWGLSKDLAVSPPVLVDHMVVGPFTVDVFEVPVVKEDAARFVLYRAKEVSSLVGAGVCATVLHCADVDVKSGQEKPGTVHKSRVKVVSWTDGEFPDVTAPDVDDVVAGVALECAVSLAVVAFNAGWSRPVWVGAQRVSERVAPTFALGEPSSEGGGGEPLEVPVPAVWAVELAMTAISVGWKHLSRELHPYLEEVLGTRVLVAGREPARLFVGPFEDAPLVAELPRTAQYVSRSPLEYLQDVAEEYEWNVRWDAIKGVGANTPTPQFLARRRDRLHNGVEVQYMPFVCRNGFPGEVLGLFTGSAEAQMSTGLGAAPFVSHQHFPAGAGQTDGGRHPQAVVVVFAQQGVPRSPAVLAPSSGRSGGDAAGWVLRALFDVAFDAAKLPRPEVVSVVALTKPDSVRHVWEVRLRLFGTTLAAVRAVESKLAAALQVPWLRFDVSGSEGTIVVLCGDPGGAEFVSEGKSRLRVAGLDWEQAFSEVGLVGANGRTPSVVDRFTLPHNSKVEVLDFVLPSPVSVERLRANESKLRAATGNLFVDVRPGVGGAQSARVTCCVEDPMPFPALFDWDVMVAESVPGSSRVPFGTGVDGEPVVFDWRANPHVLVAGTTGSGKSVVMQSLMVGAVLRGCELWVVDPSKGAADFQFVAPYAKAVVTDVLGAGEALRLVVAELDRRKGLNSQFGVSSYVGLPEEVRPVHMVVVLDEFTSLTLPEQVSGKPSDSLEVELERAEALARNEARLVVGAAVGRLAREARSAGITVVLGTQKLSAKALESVPGGDTLKSNLARILMGKTTFGDRQSALRSPEVAPVLGEVVPPGRGIFESVSDAAVVVQSWFDPGEQEALAAFLGARCVPLGVGERVVLGGGVSGGGDVVHMDVDWSEFDFGVAADDHVVDGQVVDDAAAGGVVLDVPVVDGEVVDSPTADDPVVGGVAGELVVSDLSPTGVVVVPDGWGVVDVPHSVVVNVPADTPLEAVLSRVEDQVSGSGVHQVVWVDERLGGVDDVVGLPWVEVVREALVLRGVTVVVAAEVTDEVVSVLTPGRLVPPRGDSTGGEARVLLPPAIDGLWGDGVEEF